MAAPIVSNNGSGLADLAKLFQVIAPEFGSGKTTESQSTSASPEANSQANDLLQQIAGSVNPNDIDNMIQNILVRAKQAFGPAAIGSNAAGIRAYSDTTRESLQNEAMARATAEAAAAKLGAINTANATAAKVVDTKMQTSRQVQASKQTGRSPAGTGLLLSLGAGLLSKKLGKGETAPTGPVDNSSYTPGEYGPENVANFPGDVGQGSNAAATDSIFVGDLPLADDLSAIVTNPEADILPDSSQTAAVDTGAETLSDAGTDAAIDEGTSAAVEGGSDNVLDFLDFGDFFADGGIVPGRRAPPGAFAPGVLQNQTTKPTAGMAPSIVPSNSMAAKRRAPVVLDANGNVVSEATGGSAGVTDSSGMSGAGFSFGAPSAASMALAGMHAAMGNPAAAAFSLAISALVNGTSNPDSETAAMANALDDQAAADLDMGAAMAANAGTNDAGMDFGDFGSPDSGAAAGDSASAGDSSSGDSGGSFGEGGGEGGGDGGGGDGGGEADGGAIQGNSADDYSGIDKVLIHATPGEAILPVDTVKALGGMSAIEDLIRRTHRPVRGRR
jgi:hypothetical protein